jgi:hypothetical protein
MQNVSFWSFGGMGPYLIAVPYTNDAAHTGPYIWANQGSAAAGNSFSQPLNAPGGRIGAVVGQFLMVGDVLDQVTEVIGTGNGSQSTFNFSLTKTPMLATGNVYDQAGTLAGTFNQGLISGSGLLAAPTLPGTLASLGDTFNGTIYVSSVFSLAMANDPGQALFTSITVNSVTRNSSAATYSYSGGVATWAWTAGAFGLGSGITYPVTFTGGSFSTSIVAGSITSNLNGYSPYTLTILADTTANGTYNGSQFQIASSTNPGQSAFTSITANGKTFTSASATYSYTNGFATWGWSTGPFGFTNGSSYPVTFTGAAWFSTVIAGQQSVGGLHPTSITGFSVGIGAIGSSTSTATFNGYRQSSGTGSVATAGQSTVNYEAGALTLALNGAPAAGDAIYAQYTQSVPYRIAWSAIGDPTHWPIPLTADAVAFQSGFEDLEADLGPLMLIAGYPLYGIIFQRTGITRANYVGGDIVWSFGVFSRNRGLIAKGAACQVGTLVYFLSQDGFFVTDGNSVSPIGTDQNNNVGIDNWFASNVNIAALESIRAGYDTSTRCITFSIPTGTNTLPDTLLTYNPLAARWTKCAIPTELVWTDNNGQTTAGTELRLGLFTQANQYSVLQGPTLNGYLESCDVMAVDSMQRLTTGVRPNVASTDTPQAMIGVRNSMQDAINYSVSMAPDPFSRIVPTLMEGLYTRTRVSSSAASALNGATLYQQTGGEV